MSAKRAEFWVLVSGKGGVGKSVLAVNMARDLSEQGHRVLLLDADIGLANLHVLANEDPRGRLERVLARADSLAEAITPLSFGPHLLASETGQSLSLLSGSDAAEGLAETLGQLHASYDYVLVDTPRGLSDAALRFCRACDRTLLVTSDEPTSITNSYAWFKLATLEQSSFPVWMVANQTDDEQLESRFLGLCDRFLGTSPRWAGKIPRDPHVSRAVSHQRLLFEECPTSPAWLAIKKITRRLKQATDPVQAGSADIMTTSRPIGRPR